MTDATPALFTADTLVVLQHAKFFSQRAEYDIYAPDETLLGSVHQQASVGASLFGQLATITYDVLDGAGQPLLVIEKPGNIGRAAFDVSTPGGQQVGTVEQENLLFAPQFALTAVDGSSARLTGGSFMSWEWRYEVGDGEVVGGLTKELAGLAEMFSSADRFVVQLEPRVTGPLRMLAVAAPICLDEVRTAKERHNR